MKDTYRDFLRRNEILAFVIKSFDYSKADLAMIFKVAEITINRDLHWIRSQGIPIYSKNNKVILTGSLHTNALMLLLSQYIPIKLHTNLILDSINPSSRLNAKGFYEKCIIISKAVSEKRKIDIVYRRFYDNKINSYRILPFKLYNNEYNWILNAVDESDIIEKSFHLSRINKVHLTNEIFNVTETDTSNVKKKKVILKFSPEVESQVLDKIWFDKFDLKKENDGTIVLITRQPLTNKLASWCISWWDKLTIVSPVALKILTENMIIAYKSVNTQQNQPM